MSRDPTYLGRPFGLLGVVIVMGVVIFLVGEQWRSHHASGVKHHPPQESSGPLEMILEETASFRATASAVPVDHEPETGVKVRELADCYALRHYPGAPPAIPHPVDISMTRGPDCNSCHEKGGFAPTLNAYTPVTPHPEYESCTQCHVPRNAGDLFKGTDFVATDPPPLHRPALPGGPPPIPHSLQLRDNCLACHAGPAAPLAIRTTHPERVHCRQCHVPSDGNHSFDRELISFLDQQAE